jgi:hypothetical protein
VIDERALIAILRSEADRWRRMKEHEFEDVWKSCDESRALALEDVIAIIERMAKR